MTLQRPRWRVRRTGVAPRLLGAVAVPLLLLSLVTLRDAVTRNATSGRADALVLETSTLGELVEFSEALFAEQIEIASPTGELTTERLASIREAADAALAGIGAAGRPFDVDALVRIRQMVDAGTYDTTVLIGRFEELRERVSDEITGALERSNERAVELGSADIVSAVQLLDAMLDAAEASADEVTAINDYWRSESFEADFSRSRLAAAAAAWFDGVQRIEAAAKGDIAHDWASLIIASSSFDRAVSDALAGTVPQPDPAVLAVGTARTTATNALAPMQGDRIDALATELRAESRTASARAFGLMLFSLVSSIIAACLFGRSIVMPIRRLTDVAVGVGSGELDVQPLPLRGPPDLVTAAGAFNDLIANLQLVDRKSAALAEGSLSDPILDTTLPGELGTTLDRTVRVLSDSIVAREHLQEQLEHDATHDVLTGVLNRAGLYSAIGAAIASVGDGREAWMIFVDLDDFKWVNDTYGHEAGDLVLRTVSARMSDVVGDAGHVGRLGGDEFTVILAGRDDVVHDPEELAERLAVLASRPISVDGTEVRVGASAGIARVGIDDTAEQVLRRADLAVYEAKRRGSGVVTVYDESLEREMVKRAEISDALRASLRSDGDLSLVYQPIIDAATGRLTGAETLIRWNRPGVGPVPPDEFIGVAETSHLIVEVDRWVLTTALTEASRWAVGGVLGSIRLSVNLSGRHVVDPHLVSDVESALLATGFDPARLVLEVTETVLVADLDRAADQLRRLRALGVHIAIDDFGTGYTSLAHLRALPVDSLKIDRSFVSGAGDGLAEADMVGIVCALSKRLDVVTVGEGVETAEQATVLRDLGCTSLQGFHIARPMPAAEIAAWATDRHRLTHPPFSGLRV